MEERPSKELPATSQDAPTGRDCEEARVLLSQFVHGGMKRSADRRFRQHLTRCPTCRDVYRETLASAARLGRALRDAREEEARERRRHDQRKAALQAGVRGPRSRLFGLRLALLPALVAFVWTQFDRGPTALEVVALEGRAAVLVAGDRLEEETAEIVAGQWCQTLGPGRARLDASQGRLWLGANTQLFLEEAEGGAVRLQSGEVEFEGDWRVVLQLGVVQAREARGRIRVGREGVQIDCEEGALRWGNSRGERDIVAGEGIQLGLRDLAQGP